MKIARAKSSRYVGSKWLDYDGPTYPCNGPPTTCAHCNAPLVAGSHSPLERANLCANMRLHDRIVVLEAEIRRLKAGGAVNVEEAPDSEIDVVSEEIGFEPVAQ